jgi:hypothetical protein
MTWTKTQEKDFAAMLFQMGELFESPVSKTRAELFLQAVNDLAFEVIVAAARAHIRTSTFFPKPAELRAHVLGNMSDQAAMAWEHVLREIRRVGYLGMPAWPDPVTQRAAEGLFGGWRALCEHLPGDGPELLGYRKQFIALFEASKRQSGQLELPLELPPSRDEARAALAGVTDQLAARNRSQKER